MILCERSLKREIIVSNNGKKIKNIFGRRGVFCK